MRPRVPAAAVAIDKVSGDGQTAAANRPAFPNPMVVVVRDQYGNAVEGEAVAWTVESGPVTLLAGGWDNRCGRAEHRASRAEWGGGRRRRTGRAVGWGVIGEL